MLTLQPALGHPVLTEERRHMTKKIKVSKPAKSATAAKMTRAAKAVKLAESVQASLKNGEPDVQLTEEQFIGLIREHAINEFKKIIAHRTSGSLENVCLATIDVLRHENDALKDALFNIYENIAMIEELNLDDGAIELATKTCQHVFDSLGMVAGAGNGKSTSPEEETMTFNIRPDHAFTYDAAQIR